MDCTNFSIEQNMVNKMHTLQETSMYPDMPSRMLPSFSITAKDLPEIKDWKVGGKYTLQIEVEMVSMSKNEYGKSPLDARLKIHKIGEKELLTEKEKEGMAGHY